MRKSPRARLLALALVLCVAVSMMSACQRSQSVYRDATVSVPSTYTEYTVDQMTFRFEAGWLSSDWSLVDTEMETLLESVSQTGNFALCGQLTSPATDKGTVDYIHVGYFEMGSTVAAKDLEGIMESIDSIPLTLKRMNLSGNELQKSRIRSYQNGAVEALTFCYSIEKRNTSDESSSEDEPSPSLVVQVALIPHNNRVYVLAFDDFTSGADNDSLEEMLSSLSFTN